MTYTATYTSGDLTNIVFDIVGKFLAALGENAATIVTIIILLIIILLVTDLLTGVFGIFNHLKKFR